jgi:hypothetical protein
MIYNINDSVQIKMNKINGVVVSKRTERDNTETYLVKYTNALGKEKHLRCNEFGLTSL